MGEDLPIGGVTARELQDYQLYRIPNAHRRTVDYEIDVVRAFLNWCRVRKWVRENVADKEHVERLINKKTKGNEKRVFTDDELKVLLDPHSNAHWQYPYIFAPLYYTGLRIGELGHLRVKDLDLVRHEIDVRGKTMKVPVWDAERQRNFVRELQWTPKWYEERTIPIDSRLEPILREFQERKRDNNTGLYFQGPRGNQINDQISRWIKRLTGRQDVSAHTFRHTHISYTLNRWGRHPSVVQHWVGHKRLDTTMEYIHTSVDALHREARKIGN